MSFALRIYRRLAEAFPQEFKIVYGMEVTQVGEDMVEEIAETHGVAGLFRLILDIAIRSADGIPERDAPRHGMRSARCSNRPGLRWSAFFRLASASE